jgi:hypothetical protein
MGTNVSPISPILVQFIPVQIVHTRADIFGQNCAVKIGTLMCGKCTRVHRLTFIHFIKFKLYLTVAAHSTNGS